CRSSLHLGLPRASMSAMPNLIRQMYSFNEEGKRSISEPLQIGRSRSLGLYRHFPARMANHAVGCKGFVPKRGGAVENPQTTPACRQRPPFTKIASAPLISEHLEDTTFTPASSSLNIQTSGQLTRFRIINILCQS